MTSQRSSFRLVVLTLATLAAPAAFAQSAPVLLTEPTCRTALPPGEFALADFDADGRADVVVVHPEHSSVEILLAQAGGQLLSHALFTAGPTPLDTVAADFDGDGKFDVATANVGTGMLGVLLGLGGGNLAPSLSSPLGSNPRALGVAEMDGDGKPDVVALRSTAAAVLHNAGSGAFAPQPAVGADGESRSLALGDFDADGDVDVAVAEITGHVRLLLGGGDGSLAPGGSVNVGNGAYSITSADFNGDGHPDLATANLDDDTVSVLLGQGAGAFGSAPSLGVSHEPVAVEAVDLDEDGRADLACISAADGTADVLLGVGDGSFEPRMTWGACYAPVSLHVADVDGDSHADLVTVNQQAWFTPLPTTTSVSVLRGRGDGTLRANTRMPNANSMQTGAAGDLDGDGRDDIVLGCSLPKAVKVGLGRGDGRFDDLGFFGEGQLVGAPSSLALADIDADGVLDVATAAKLGQNEVAVLLGTGSGALSFAGSSPVGLAPFAVAVGDFDGDGLPDLVSADAGDDQVSVLAGQGDGTLAPAVAWSVTDPQSLALADYDADGDLDVAVGCVNAVALLLNQAGGGFAPGTSVTLSGHVPSLLVGDFDENGKPDLAGLLVFMQERKLAVLVAHANAHFDTKLSPLAGGPGLLALLDADGDGHQDLLLADGQDNTLNLLRGLGDASFADAGLYGSGSGTQALAVGDFETDGRPDVAAVPNYNGTNLSVMVTLNDAPSAWSPIGFGLPGTHGQPVLYGVGLLQAGSANALHLAGAKASAPATLVMGFAQQPQPFKGGTLVPSPTLLVPLVTDSSGQLALPFTMPAAPSGLTLVLQAWITDGAAVHGLAATGALLGTVP